MDILDDMGVSKLSANFFFKVNYSFKCIHIKIIKMCFLKHNKSARDKVHLIRDVQRYESHDSQSHTMKLTGQR